MLRRGRNDVMMRYHFERFDKVKEALREMFAAARSILGRKGSLPRCSLCAHARTTVQTRTAMRLFPVSSDLESSPHPNPDNSRKQADWATTAIGLRKENNENSVHSLGPGTE